MAADAATQRSAPVRAAPKPVDPLDGVELYITYGRFAEARAMLDKAIADQPNRLDLRYKQLRVLAVENPENSASGGLGLATHDRDLLAQQPIQKCGFACVGAPQERDHACAVAGGGHTDSAPTRSRPCSAARRSARRLVRPWP